MLFLLKDANGKALLIADAASKSQASAFGFSHLPGFCGDGVELDPASRAEAEEFWGVRTVRVLTLQIDPKPRSLAASAITNSTPVLVHGPELPEEVEADGLLTAEDHRDLTLDHIARTCDIVVKMEIFKRS